ncbi:cytochrome b [Rugamonas sp. CCM 8940]|uniref:cytochrome b n=1 Tax=Rugamonas sp. CCM 8940 TaxID=2765359 RepID=UPI0018F7475F|nr:cytochrome b [Rugamonas sp. CCM 8940]MBJ7310038.1 cytochrome b [Rugamonas sp. CCM 8940]
MNQYKPSSHPTAPAWRYAAPARLLHWLLALLIVVLIGVGWYMMEIEDDPGSAVYFMLHKSFGLVAAGLVAARLLWRFGHRPAPLPGNVAPWQVRLSGLTHGLLYLCMALMPLTGIIGAALSKRGLVFFGLTLPRWFVPDHDLAEQYFDAHGVIAWVLVALIVLHVAAGLKHLLVDKDGVFQRMG